MGLVHNAHCSAGNSKILSDEALACHALPAISIVTTSRIRFFFSPLKWRKGKKKGHPVRWIHFFVSADFGRPRGVPGTAGHAARLAVLD